MKITDVDKAKVRTAVKCYLTFKNEATAKQLNDFLLTLDLKLRRDLTTNELARELTYCCKNKNFLNIQSHTRKRDNYTLYSLRRG